MEPSLKLYDALLSGNSYKARLLLRLLDLPFERIAVDLGAGEQRSPTFLRISPVGQVPVLEDGGVVVRDSQAILVYLARRYGGEAWLPTSPEGLSSISQWLSFAANELANGLATVRAARLFGTPVPDLDGATRLAARSLDLLDGHLAERRWLELDRPTIADVACFPYIYLSGDGGVPLDPYPHVARWVDRFRKLPGFHEIDAVGGPSDGRLCAPGGEGTPGRGRHAA